MSPQVSAASLMLMTSKFHSLSLGISFTYMAPTNQREHGYFSFCNFLTNSLHWNSEGKKKKRLQSSICQREASIHRWRECCVGSGERSADTHRRGGRVAGLHHSARLEAWSSGTQMFHPNQTGHTAWGWPALQSQQGKVKRQQGRAPMHTKALDFP